MHLAIKSLPVGDNKQKCTDPKQYEKASLENAIYHKNCNSVLISSSPNDELDGNINEKTGDNHNHKSTDNCIVQDSPTSESIVYEESGSIHHENCNSVFTLPSDCSPVNELDERFTNETKNIDSSVISIVQDSPVSESSVIEEFDSIHHKNRNTVLTTSNNRSTVNKLGESFTEKEINNDKSSEETCMVQDSPLTDPSLYEETEPNSQYFQEACSLNELTSNKSCSTTAIEDSASSLELQNAATQKLEIVSWADVVIDDSATRKQQMTRKISALYVRTLAALRRRTPGKPTVCKYDSINESDDEFLESGNERQLLSRPINRNRCGDGDFRQENTFRRKEASSRDPYRPYTKRNIPDSLVDRHDDFRKENFTSKRGNGNSKFAKPLESDGIFSDVVGIVENMGRDWFHVKVEEGPNKNKIVECQRRQMADYSTPVVDKKTKFHLRVKINPDDNETITVVYATPLEYVELTAWDVERALLLVSRDSHEDFIKKLYFPWRQFFDSMMVYVQNFDEETLLLILDRFLPLNDEYDPHKNQHHQFRFQELLKILAGEGSPFIFRLWQFPVVSKPLLVKRLALWVSRIIKDLEPVRCLLRKYYEDDAEGLIELIETCCKDSTEALRSLDGGNFRTVPLFPIMKELTGVINSLVVGSSKDTETRNLLQLESHLSPNRIDGPWNSAEEYLDVHFRLLREECFASIRNRIANVRLDPKDLNEVHRGVRVIGYAADNGAVVLQLKFTPHKSRSNLMFGNLVCIDVDTNFANPIWATVQSFNMRMNILGITLVGIANIDENRLETSNKFTNELLASTIQRLAACQSGVMVDSPTYYHAFKPVLARLKELYEGNFVFDSEILLKSTEPVTSLWYRFYNPRRINLDLDESQKEALAASVENRFTLIQGPPGCGKTYVGREVIASLLNSSSNPILLLAYKNHALDSMLESCLDLTHSVARIGGNCVSEKLKRFKLQNLFPELREHYSREDYEELKERRNDLDNLRDCMQHATGHLLTGGFSSSELLWYLQKNHWEKQLQSLLVKNFETNYGHIINQNVKYSSKEEVNSAVAEILSSKQELASKLLSLSIREWLSETDSLKLLPNSRNSLFSSRESNSTKENNVYDEEQMKEWDEVFAERNVESDSKVKFVTLSQRRSSFYSDLQNYIASNAEKNERMHDTRMVKDVWCLTTEGRFVLLSHWFRKLLNERSDRFVQTLRCYQNFHEEVQFHLDERNLTILTNKQIVACTITGSCLNMRLLDELSPNIAIVEEAAEILESQLIAALPPSVRHLVLIGDHRQLPPQVNQFRLAKVYNLGVSIFERLANNGYPISQLRFHRRGPQSLCPLFSRFYDQEIVAMKGDPEPPTVLSKLGNMFWWTHNAPATVPHQSASLENEFEAAMIVGAINFLIWQGEVTPSQITIIAAYQGQAKKLKKLLSAQYITGVAVCTLDRFQGDENDFIFLSLTRSSNENDNRSIGFLNSPNRTCVALSRARVCLYIFGCSRVFRLNHIWKETVEYFESKGKLGNKLEFVYAGKSIEFDDPNDFEVFFKRIIFQNEGKRLELRDKMLEDFPEEDNPHRLLDVTEEFREKIEKLMNDSILDVNDLGRERDAHSERFNSFQVNSVKQIINPDMYSIYKHHLKSIENDEFSQIDFEIDSMADWTAQSLNSKANEVYLFHGTNAGNAEIIMECGFDERVSNLEGMFGAGIYFSENADKADQYFGEEKMFLSRVILGRVYKTKVPVNWRRPPPVDPPKPTKLFHSIVAVSRRKTGQGAVERHQEFVIFDRYQCFPEFLIEYKRRCS